MQKNDSQPISKILICNETSWVANLLKKNLEESFQNLQVFVLDKKITSPEDFLPLAPSLLLFTKEQQKEKFDWEYQNKNSAPPMILLLDAKESENFDKEFWISHYQTKGFLHKPFEYQIFIDLIASLLPLKLKPQLKKTLENFEVMDSEMVGLFEMQPSQKEGKENLPTEAEKQAARLVGILNSPAESFNDLTFHGINFEQEGKQNHPQQSSSFNFASDLPSFSVPLVEKNSPPLSKKADKDYGQDVFDQITAQVLKKEELKTVDFERKKGPFLSEDEKENQHSFDSSTSFLEEKTKEQQKPLKGKGKLSVKESFARLKNQWFGKSTEKEKTENQEGELFRIEQLEQPTAELAKDGHFRITFPVAAEKNGQQEPFSLPRQDPSQNQPEPFADDFRVADFPQKADLAQEDWRFESPADQNKEQDLKNEQPFLASNKEFSPQKEQAETQKTTDSFPPAVEDFAFSFPEDSSDEKEEQNDPQEKQEIDFFANPQEPIKKDAEEEPHVLSNEFPSDAVLSDDVLPNENKELELAREEWDGKSEWNEEALNDLPANLDMDFILAETNFSNTPKQENYGSNATMIDVALNRYVDSKEDGALLVEEREKDFYNLIADTLEGETTLVEEQKNGQSAPTSAEDFDLSSKEEPAAKEHNLEEPASEIDLKTKGNVLSSSKIDALKSQLQSTFPEKLSQTTEVAGQANFEEILLSEPKAEGEKPIPNGLEEEFHFLKTQKNLPEKDTFFQPNSMGLGRIDLEQNGNEEEKSLPGSKPLILNKEGILQRLQQAKKSDPTKLHQQLLEMEEHIQQAEKHTQISKQILNQIRQTEEGQV